jgi:hypothetical protein
MRLQSLKRQCAVSMGVGPGRHPCQSPGVSSFRSSRRTSIKILQAEIIVGCAAAPDPLARSRTLSPTRCGLSVHAWSAGGRRAMTRSSAWASKAGSRCSSVGRRTIFASGATSTRPRVSVLFIARAPCSHLGIGGAEAGAGAMLVACRLAGLSTLETYYAGVRAPAQFGPTPRSRDKAHVARAEALPLALTGTSGVRGWESCWIPVPAKM